MKTYAKWDDCAVIADEVLKVARKAVLCRFGEYDEVWLPLSQIDSSDLEEGVIQAHILMPFWLAEKHGLEEFIQD